MIRVSYDRVFLKYFTGTIMVFLMAVCAGDLRGG